jgi:hypothetical protein
MLLTPERNQRRFEPVMEGGQAMDAGVASGAEGNQPAAGVGLAPISSGRTARRPTGERRAGARRAEPAGAKPREE